MLEKDKYLLSLCVNHHNLLGKITWNFITLAKKTRHTEKISPAVCKQ